MSKAILLISASPRKAGNSDILCDEFMRGAKEAGHAVEKIRLSDQKIQYCTGCCACVNRQGACVQKDDMNALMLKFLAADVLVLATPVYFHDMNGQMKTFMDRTCPIYSLVSSKEVYYAVAAAGGRDQIESAVNSLRVYTESFSGMREKGVLSITGIWNEGEARGSPAAQKAYAAGLNA